MYRSWGDRVAFLFVYVREAHPSDEWQMPVNEEQGVVFRQPTTWDERRELAEKCCTATKLSMTCVVDTLDDAVDTAYAGWPERLFVIGADGRIAYAGGPGPFGFKPREVTQWLRKNIGPPSKRFALDRRSNEADNNRSLDDAQVTTRRERPRKRRLNRPRSTADCRPIDGKGLVPMRGLSPHADILRSWAEHRLFSRIT